jgi:ABC-type branched-subunit amino acid transport system substrate-binding protein
MSIGRKSIFAPLTLSALLIAGAVFASGAAAVSHPSADLSGLSIVLAPGQRLEIAVPVDQTTPFAAAIGTAARNAVQLAIASHPQIKGFAVQQDDVAAVPCNDAMANAAAATSIVANPHVAGVVGHLCSTGLAGALPVYESAGMVVLSGSATDPSLPALGPSVFDRTIVNDADNGATWLTSVEQLPSVLAWQQRYQARFGIAPTTFAELYYDAANLLLARINQVATIDPSGNLVIDRRMLAAAVRHTTNFQGVSGCISLDAVGNRFNNLGACS